MPWKTSGGNPDNRLRRARRRLTDVTLLRPNVWAVRGRKELDDYHDSYTVTYDEATGRWACTCHQHVGGGIRSAAGCTHILAVRLSACQRNPDSADLQAQEVHPATTSPTPEPAPEPARLEQGLVVRPTRSRLARDVPIPPELHLPAKFTHWRPEQHLAIQWAKRQEAPVLILEAPTGVGKSLIAATLQRVWDTKLGYVCHFRYLQDQLQRDFPYAYVLKGRRNYPTANYPDEFPRIHAGLCMRRGPSGKCPLCYDDETGQHYCPYEKAKQQALSSDFTVLNYALFLTEANYVGQFAGLPFVVLDEGDLAEASLMQFVEVNISKRMVSRYNIPAPPTKTKTAQWVAWAEQVRQQLRTVRKNTGSRDPAELEEQAQLARLIARLDFFLDTQEGAAWVLCSDNLDKGPWVFRPVYVSPFAPDMLWAHGKRFLVMSASIINPYQFARDLGLREGQWAFLRLSSPFPVERRPIYVRPAANMTKSGEAREWPRLLVGLDKLLSELDERTLVHTVSYGLAKYLAENSRHRDRMVMYNDASQHGEALQRYLDRKDAVLIAPSMSRGVDLPDDACRNIVVAKVPYPYLGDKQVSARLYSGRDGSQWYAVQTARELVQATGRGMRHAGDFCRTFILDKQFINFVGRHPRLLPEWWLAAVHYE